MSGLLARAVLIAAAVVVAVYAEPAKATKIERVVSPGGIEAWLVEDHLNPIISLHLAFRGGSALDPKGKEGLANMVSTLLDEGAGDLDSKAFQQTLEDNSITLRFSAARDSFGARVQVLSEYRDLAFDLLRQAMTKPRFDAEPVSRLRAQLLANLRHESEDADAIAGKTLMKALYPDHPYGRPTGGTPESVAAIQVTDLRAFVKERLALDTLAIGVVGDITAKELAPLLDKTFGALPAKAAPWKVAEVAPKTAGRTIVVEKPLKQSNILFADRGLMRKDPDFYAAYVMNHILGGGGFSSRLTTEVREKRGLAYSTYAYLAPLDRAGLYMGGVGTANERVAESLDVIRAEWRRMAEQGVTAEELQKAKQYLTGAWPLRFDGNAKIASMLVGLQRDGFGPEYLDQRNGLVEAVTLDDIARVAAQWLKPDALHFVVVGQPEGLPAIQ